MLIAFNAHTLTRLPHMQAQHAEFLPLALLSLDALLRTPRWSWAIWLAVWFVLQSLTSLHLLVFAAVALAVGAAVRPEDWIGDRFRVVLPRALGAAVIALLALAPYLWPYWQLHQAGLGRSLDEVAFFSAHASDYLTTPSVIHRSIGTSARGANALFPGVTALLLVAIALVRGSPLRDRRTRMCAAFGLLGFVLSFGPNVAGYPWLFTTVPLFQAIRASSRFAYLGLFAVAVLGGFGVAVLRQSISSRAARISVSVVVLAVLFAETFSGPIVYQRFDGIPAIYELPAAAANSIVVDVPFHAPDATYRNAPYVLGSTSHFRPVLNGYSGFTPPSYFAHYEQLRTFPDESSIRALQSAGVTHVFAHLDRLDSNFENAVTRFTALHRVARDGSIVLYQLDTSESR